MTTTVVGSIYKWVTYVVRYSLKHWKTELWRIDKPGLVLHFYPLSHTTAYSEQLFVYIIQAMYKHIPLGYFTYLGTGFTNYLMYSESFVKFHVRPILSNELKEKRAQ